MNLELVEKMTELLTSRRARRSELAIQYKTAKGEEAKRIYDEVAEIVKGNNEINAAIKNYKKAEEEFNNTSNEEEQFEASNKYLLAEEALIELANKYGVEMVQELPEEKIEEENIAEEIVENRTEEKKNNTLKYIAIGAMGLGIGAGVTACAMSQGASAASLEEETQNTEDKEEQLETEVEEEFKETTTPTEEKEEELKIEDVDTELYGMSAPFTDASDETQVMQRATDIYNLYVNTENMPEAMKQQLSIERIANFIRMANGEFALEDGQIDYNGSMFDEMGNFINENDNFHPNSNGYQVIGEAVYHSFIHTGIE